jgi:serine/threonine-protein kinase
VPLLIGLALAVGGLLYAALFVWTLTSPREIVVPKVTGIQEQAAREILVRKGLRPKVIGRQMSELPAGSVIGTYPDAGRIVKRGRSIDLILSVGSTTVMVPDVTELQAERAAGLLVEKGFHVSRQLVAFNEKIPTGYVISQEPAGGRKANRGSGIELTVSAGEAPTISIERQDGQGDTRSAQVEVYLDPDGSRHQVKIVMRDDTGGGLIHDESHAPGETVTESVTGVGRTTIQVFIDGVKAEEQRI